jgi:hypothetical protein
LVGLTGQSKKVDDFPSLNKAEARGPYFPRERCGGEGKMGGGKMTRLTAVIVVVEASCSFRAIGAAISTGAAAAFFSFLLTRGVAFSNLNWAPLIMRAISSISGSGVVNDEASCSFKAIGAAFSTGAAAASRAFSFFSFLLAFFLPLPVDFLRATILCELDLAASISISV